MLFTFKRLLITPLVFSVIAMLSGRADAEVYKKLYNTDIVGADLSGADRRGVSEDQCATICNSMKSCTAYSWVVDTEWCWPKSNASRTKEAIGIFSGVISLRTNSQPPQIREVDTFVLPGKCLVVAASRATLDEARRFVVELDERLDNVRVFRSENGWYAVTVGIYDYNRGVNSASELISQGMIPTDAFCSSGKSYVE
ncbi:MAG: hypothetical protein ABJN18_00400, partial [Marinobacter sp.]|uniref:hypothetical protein n=1 Tax=Marinobacter sp. TaxID=50741 RepID=UPI0032978CD3